MEPAAPFSSGMWERLAHEAPALLILAIIVWWIMRAQKERDKAASETQQLFLAHIQAKDQRDEERDRRREAQDVAWREKFGTLGKECHDFQAGMQTKFEAFVDKTNSAMVHVSTEIRAAAEALRHPNNNPGA